MENKFKVGDKVKIPKTKTVKCYGNIEDSHVIKRAKEIQQDFLYITDVPDYSDGDYTLDYVLSDSGDYFAESDLELYVDIKSGMVGSEYDDIEKFKTESGLDKVIVVNPTNKYTEEFDRLTESEESYASYIVEESIKSLEIIADKDLAFYLELENLIKYLASTYSDKYENTDNYSKRKLLSKEGKAANMFTALKYIQRYDTVGYSKSENPQDLLKSCHYLLFENQRKTKHGNSN